MIVQIIFVITGLALILVSVLSLARRRMTETIVLVWAFVGVIFVLAGVLLRPVYWNNYISTTALVLFTLVGVCLLFCAYFFTVKTSELIRKSNELAIQVSLLKHEVELLRKDGDNTPKEQ